MKLTRKSEKLLDELVGEDMFKILHCLTAPKPTTEEEALAQSSARLGWEIKYGDSVVEYLEDILYNLDGEISDRVYEGDIILGEAQ